MRKIIKIEEVIPDQYETIGGLIKKHKRNLKTGKKLVTVECGHREVRPITKVNKGYVICNFCAEADGVVL
jgi:hypothetical protein